MNLQILLALPGFTEGQVVTVETDESNIPLDKYWRRRLHDAKKDNCVVELTDEQVEAANKVAIDGQKANQKRFKDNKEKRDALNKKLDEDGAAQIDQTQEIVKPKSAKKGA